MSIFQYQQAIEESGVNYLNISSWFDSGYGDAVIKRFMNMNSSGIYVIGDWNHGFRASANPYYPKRKQIISTMTMKEAASTFIHYLSDFLDIALSDTIEEKILYYYTLGEEKWKKRFLV